MPRLTHLKIYDDEGEEMLAGCRVLVNGEHERLIYFDDDKQITLSDWNMEEDTIFSIQKLRDDRHDDFDEPNIETPDPRRPPGVASIETDGQ